MKSALRMGLVTVGLAATACGGDGGGRPGERALATGAGRESYGTPEVAAAATDAQPVDAAYAGDGCLWSVEYVVETSLTDTGGTGFSALDALAAFNTPGHGTVRWHDGTTSTVTIAAVAQTDSAKVDHPPRDEGYCVPTLTVPIELRVATADGRLSEAVATSLTAVGYDGNIETVFVDAGLPLDDLRGDLAIPADWLIPGHVVRRLVLNLSWTRPGGTSAWCLPGEERSMDPDETCNDYDGVARFYSSVEDPWADDVATPDEISERLVGWWTLDG
jgi:hypothetical protein